MEIAPIPGIRAIIANRTPRSESDLSPAFDINAPEQNGRQRRDNAMSSKAAGAEEDDEELTQPKMKKPLSVQRA